MQKYWFSFGEPTLIRYKAKKRISKRVFQQKKNMLNFWNNKHFLPLDTHTYLHVSRGNFFFIFWKIWPALFFWKTRFEIRPFVLLPAKYKNYLSIKIEAKNCFHGKKNIFHSFPKVDWDWILKIKLLEILVEKLHGYTN